jgi:hypothetical protein
MSVDVQRANLLADARADWLAQQQTKRLEATQAETAKKVDDTPPSNSQLIASDLQLAKKIAALESSTTNLTALAYSTSTISVVG